FRSERWPASNRNGWPASIWNAWPASSESASVGSSVKFSRSTQAPGRCILSRASYLFRSESVSEGHPDKVCDRVSDEVVDAYFDVGPRCGWDQRDVRVACETLATTNRIVIAGETRGPSQITRGYIAHLARVAVKDIGYEQSGFHWKKVAVEVYLH